MQPELPPAGHNTPDLPSLSLDEITAVEEAREALATLKRSFEFWIVVARGLRKLKDKADRIGGRFTFDRLREREGLGGKRKDGADILNKTRVSRLLAILDKLDAVEKWRADLTAKQRFEWASPEAIHRHCPVFAKPNENGDLDEAELDGKQRKPSAKELQEQLTESRKLLAADDGGNLFTEESTAEQIATSVANTIRTSPWKMRQVAALLNKLAKDYEDRINVARPKGGKRR
jgi:hypothetical protein